MSVIEWRAHLEPIFKEVLSVGAQVRDTLSGTATVKISGWHVLLTCLALYFWTRIEKTPRTPKYRGNTDDESTRRKRITKLRANSKLFPSPYPNGWYYLCLTDDVQPGDVLPVSACGREFVVFRAKAKKDGVRKIGVLHAFCPHLGTHLGHGGTVKGDTIVCPYHQWAFDPEGKCKEIPYCNRDLGAIGGRVNTRSYETRELLGMLFVWVHADDEPPFYELTMLEEMRGMVHAGDLQVPSWHMHVMEPSQNSCDWYHFRTVHQWLGQADEERLKLLWVEHTCATCIPQKGDLEDDGRPIPPQVVFIKEDVTRAFLFGVIPVPGFTFKHFKAEARFQGPGVSVFRVSSFLLGTCKIAFTFTPQAPFLQRCTARIFRTRMFPQWLATFLARNAVATIEQDRKVWENKIAIAPRNVVAGDGPFAAYGTWIKQFYSESSPNWGDLSVEW